VHHILIFIALILYIESAMAMDYTYQIRQAQRACKVEQISMLRDRHGTPSCQKVQDLIALQRLQVEAQVSRETGQPMPSHNTTTILQSNVNRAPIRYRPATSAPQLMYDQSAKEWCWSYQEGPRRRCY
jgi:hypothetical protein